MFKKAVFLAFLLLFTVSLAAPTESESDTDGEVKDGSNGDEQLEKENEPAKTNVEEETGEVHVGPSIFPPPDEEEKAYDDGHNAEQKPSNNEDEEQEDSNSKTDDDAKSNEEDEAIDSKEGLESKDDGGSLDDNQTEPDQQDSNSSSTNEEKEDDSSKDRSAEMSKTEFQNNAGKVKPDTTDRSGSQSQSQDSRQNPTNPQSTQNGGFLQNSLGTGRGVYSPSQLTNQPPFNSYYQQRPQYTNQQYYPSNGGGGYYNPNRNQVPNQIFPSNWQGTTQNQQPQGQGATNPQIWQNQQPGSNNYPPSQWTSGMRQPPNNIPNQNQPNDVNHNQYGKKEEEQPQANTPDTKNQPVEQESKTFEDDKNKDEKDDLTSKEEENPEQTQEDSTDDNKEKNSDFDGEAPEIPDPDGQKQTGEQENQNAAPSAFDDESQAEHMPEDGDGLNGDGSEKTPDQIDSEKAVEQGQQEEETNNLPPQNDGIDQNEETNDGVGPSVPDGTKQEFSSNNVYGDLLSPNDVENEPPLFSDNAGNKAPDDQNSNGLDNKESSDDASEQSNEDEKEKPHKSSKPHKTDSRKYTGHSSWHFITIFLFAAVIGIVAYFALHNRKKLREGVSGYVSNGNGRKRRMREYQPLSQQ